MNENEKKRSYKKYFSSAYILAALVTLLVIGRTLSLIDYNLGTHLSTYSSWIATAVLLLFFIFVYTAITTRKK